MQKQRRQPAPRPLSPRAAPPCRHAAPSSPMRLLLSPSLSTTTHPLCVLLLRRPHCPWGGRRILVEPLMKEEGRPMLPCVRGGRRARPPASLWLSPPLLNPWNRGSYLREASGISPPGGGRVVGVGAPSLSRPWASRRRSQGCNRRWESSPSARLWHTMTSPQRLTGKSAVRPPAPRLAGPEAARGTLTSRVPQVRGSSLKGLRRHLRELHSMCPPRFEGGSGAHFDPGRGS